MNRLNKKKTDITEQFIHCLHESSYFDYQNALEYISREKKSIHNLEVRTLFQLNGKPAKLSIILLPAGKIAQTQLLHLISQKSIRTTDPDHFSQVEKLTNVGQIAAGIAHELNTPLGSIILSATSIVDSSQCSEIIEEANRIKKRAEHCSTVVKELLGYVRHGDKGYKENNLFDIANKVISLTESECRKRDIILTVRPQDNNMIIVCNENQIEQVLFNLINNAMYAIDKNGQINVNLYCDDFLKRTHIVIEDDGKGISSKNVEKIFDPFFTTKPGAQGTGLGLALCKKIIMEHGGDISVKSVENQGTTFDAWLPIGNE